MEKRIKNVFRLGTFVHSFQSQIPSFHLIPVARSHTTCVHIPLVENECNSNNLEQNRSLNIKKPKGIKRPYTDEEYNETSYYIQNGLRKVYPYFFTYKAFTKERWCGKRILDVFATEFRVRPDPIEECKRRINEGLLTVNNERVNIDYLLKHNDFLSSTVHRHELPVKDDSISILHKDEEKLVVNKPASIPVHPCGRYRHNTILFILAKEYNLKNLLPVHRLDRLTSGILIFGINPDKAHSLAQEFHDHTVTKEYICRVKGNFPKGLTVCEEPIEVSHRMIGISKISPSGKPSTTIFEKISYNGKTSLVVCKPVTGRTHQIRVHLQYLGFPVVKDPLYNSSVFGPEKGKGGRIDKSDAQLVKDIMDMEEHRQVKNKLYTDSEIDYLNCLKNCGTSPANGREGNRMLYSVSNSVDSLESSIHSKPYVNFSEQMMDATANGLSFNPQKMNFDENCHECKIIFNDPDPSELIMCLHAWKYKGSDWSYESELPFWTRDDWNE